MNNIFITGASSSIGREFLIKNNKKNNLIIAQYNKSKDFLEFIKKNNFKSTIITFKCDLNRKNQIDKLLSSMNNVFDDIEFTLLQTH